MKRRLLFLIFALAIVSFGCSTDSKDSGVAKPATEVQKEDGSTVAVSTGANGIKSESRTFQSGDVSRATRITYPDGRRRAVVEFREGGRSVELKEKNDIDNLMEASADSIKDVATKTWEATKTVSEKIGDKTADTAKEVSDKAKSGAEATKDAAADAAEVTGKGLKKAGKAAKKAGEKIKDKVTP
jgi:gas vesicle protein